MHTNFHASVKKHFRSTCKNLSPEIKYVQLPNQCVHIIILNLTFLGKASPHSDIMITYKRLDNVVGLERSPFFDDVILAISHFLNTFHFISLFS